MHKLTPLWDADILQYESVFAAEARWRHFQEEKGFTSEEPSPTDWVLEHIKKTVTYVHSQIGIEKDPIMYFTGPTNFRNDVAVTRKYKERPAERPFHYANAKALIQGMFEWEESVDMEADDLIVIKMTTSPEDFICISRDKDLLQAQGWHYQWESHNQPSFGPFKVEGYGEISLGKDLKGWGDKFFLAQCIMGDPTDTIPGLPRKGKAAAYKALKDTTSYEEGIEAVINLYKEVKGDEWKEYLNEQGRLLHLLREKTDLWGVNDTCTSTPEETQLEHT